jgi:hypothetical protein
MKALTLSPIFLFFFNFKLRIPENTPTYTVYRVLGSKPLRIFFNSDAKFHSLRSNHCCGPRFGPF